MSVALVILAAGASERLGECKALAQVGTTTPLRALLAAGTAFCDERPLIIAGRDCDAIRAAAPAACEVVFSSLWRLGRTTSVARAVELRPGRDLCLAPVDVPLVPREVFDALARAWMDAGSPPRGWLAPRVLFERRVRYGHPLVVGRELLTRLDASAPLRDLRALADPLLAVDVESPRILDDLDTSADLERLRNLFRA